jgi:hypothetical protein
MIVLSRTLVVRNVFEDFVPLECRTKGKGSVDLLFWRCKVFLELADLESQLASRVGQSFLPIVIELLPFSGVSIAKMLCT